MTASSGPLTSAFVTSATRVFPHPPHPHRPSPPSLCSACALPMQGAFVRALGTVFHLNCFKCPDCGDVVAAKFFPIDGPDGKQQPLCERDYFRRLNLICVKCTLALRGSYITACNKKYHVEHFTCSLCPTLFGPQDSYYERDGDVYCHFHYSTRFATKCAGCSSAILKEFVEINRNMRDECWHPECYMIHKFWNVKVVSRRSTGSTIGGSDPGPLHVEEEERESPISLKEKQVRMEQLVYRIWTILSAFEETSAACISDMLRQVGNGQYIDAIRMAEKFILHVEVLFGTIDDLEYHYARLNVKGMSHVREARMLCRKTINLFTLLSHTQETGSRRIDMTQELLAIVSGLAHYLKILIRIALVGALRLEREQNVREAVSSFLDKLHILAIQSGDPAARRIIKSNDGEVLGQANSGNLGTQGVTYGYKSLAPELAGESPFSASCPSRLSVNNPPSDLCVKCSLCVEADCVRLGTYQRWHSHCLHCSNCGKAAAVLPKDPAPPKAADGEEKEKDETDKDSKSPVTRRSAANVSMFVYDVESVQETPPFGDIPSLILCTDHAHANCRGGFQPVSRLEQYAFILNVALRRLYVVLKQQEVMPLLPGMPLGHTCHSSMNERPASSTAPKGGDQDIYRNSGDTMRMKSIDLDHKLSATARLPKRPTIVESPTGGTVQHLEPVNVQRSLRKANRVMDTLGCLPYTAVEMDKPTELLDQHAKCTLSEESDGIHLSTSVFQPDVKERRTEKLVRLEETAVDILIERAKAHIAQGVWAEALGETAEVIKLDLPIDWGYDKVLKSWAEVELTNKPWKDVMTGIGHFMVPKCLSYRAVCEQLASSGHMNDAVECLQRMEDDSELHSDSCKTDLYGEQMKWVLEFKKCCAIKLVEEGDMAAKTQHYDKAIARYSVALSLDSSNPPDILIKRSKIYMAKKLWADALDDANQVTMIDPLSPWDRDVVLWKWARSELAGGSWRSVLETASDFKVPRFRVYQALCECLEIMDLVVDAIKCFCQMAHEIPQDTEDEQIKWTRDFKARCCDKSEALGKTLMNSRQYDEAISLYSVALSLNPANLIPLLAKRSQAYEARGLSVDALDDANEIITLDPSSPFGHERRCAALHGAGCHQAALETFETMLLKLSTSSDPSVRVRCQRHATTKEVIREAIQHAIRESPPVLINTTSGRVCNKSEQAAAFELLPVFTELVLTTTRTIDHARIQQEVEQYYRYATLSHKWEDNEPLFEKVVHTVIYDLDQSPAHNKLQMFCRTVRDAGFHWAWSDTCCINKADHHILQEALVSMFKWYRGSAQTAVLLHDVHPPSRRGDLVRSIWNRRAWTLQEYHASRVVRFYNADWTPYLNLDIPNYKESPEIISEMEKATGVSARALRALQPGPDDIRDKLRLASARQTTRVEDAAYSLLGIFSISLPVLYGEGDKALGKLLAQLLTSSGDASILAWTGRSGSFNSCLPTDIAVFRELPTTHVPQTIQSAERDTAAARLLASSLSAALVMQLYDQLDELSVPFFVGQRMKLPCIAFKLGPVSTREGSPRVFRAQTVALGIVEIRTDEDLSRFDSLYLVHPWVDFLLDRQPVGSSTAEAISEVVSLHSTSGLGMGEVPVTGPFNVVPTVPETRTAWFRTMNIARLGLAFGGWPSTSTATMEDVASLRPPSSVTQTEKRTLAFRVISRLKQPFGALLLTRHLGHVSAYRRVATERLITVQVEDMTPAILNKIMSSVRVLDVL